MRPGEPVRTSTTLGHIVLDDRKQRVPKDAHPPLSWCLRPRAWLRAFGGAGEAVAIPLLLPPGMGYAFGFWLLPTAPVWVQWVVFILCAAVTVVAILTTFSYADSKFRMRDQRKQELLPLGRCAACAYTLRGIASEQDGCTICPECGCAWQVQSPPITDGKPNYVVDATGSKRRPCPEFQRLRKKHREPRTMRQWIGFVVQLFGMLLIIFGIALLTVTNLPIPGVVTVGAGCVIVIFTLAIGQRPERTADAVAAALADSHCPACWSDFGPDQISCQSCFAIWRVQSSDDD